MSIRQADEIDYIAWDDDATVSLMVSDHMDWEDSDEHIRLLEAKVGGYLAYITTGRLAEEHPDARGRAVWIRVWGNSLPSYAGELWHKKAGRRCRKNGVQYEFRHRPLKVVDGQWRLG
ncbi:MAG: hypothetical protein ICCCNLDF_01488 [Planctomycetes bacterium]|nr:hypothetical protein [Planctomycetota bacterium]